MKGKPGSTIAIRRAVMYTHIGILAAVAVCILGLSPAVLADDAGRLHWKAVPDAQVKLDDKLPLAWNVFQLDKKKNPNWVLILLGRRYILLDSKARLAYQVLPTDLKAQGSDFDSDNLAQQQRIIPSTDWTVRDIGPAEQIKLTLQDYGRVVSVDLPHPIDFRLGIY